VTYAQERIRNFCIVAHVDHGKSTLADRMLQVTGVVDERHMRAQYLDKMDIERERGITIKAQTVRMPYRPLGDAGDEYLLNLIDTPGHVDFSYEVSRAIAACEGAVLLIDAAQGLEAQTLANLYLALDADLEIIPVLNKIDLPAARPDEIAEEIGSVLGVEPSSVIRISAKDGTNVDAVLDAVVDRVPPPSGDAAAPTRALVFDSVYDPYRGALVYFRVVDGHMRRGDRIRMLATGFEGEVDTLAVQSPEETEVDELGVGEVGVLSAAIKSVASAKVGDTVTLAGKAAAGVTMLPGYQEPLPMVFSGLFPLDSDDFPLLRDALDKLRLNDASFSFEPETSVALGFGFRCGFLGLLHLEIVMERIDREFNIPLVTTAPSVRYRVTLAEVRDEEGRPKVLEVPNPQDMPDSGRIASVAEPTVMARILTPKEALGPIMQLCEQRRGEMLAMDYLTPERIELRYRLPLAATITDFFDQLKSLSRGYASMDYELSDYVEAPLVRVDLLLNGKLKELIPRQMFDIPVQAAIGAKVIARETIKARRKDVLAKCYGGDVSRKRKLLEKQKEGKKRMKSVGSVEIPPEAFVSALRVSRDG